MLDRGELQDWLNSPEIITEGLLALLGFYLFIVHTLTFKQPFLNPGLFKDRNFMTGNVLIFVIGIVLFATLALIPPMLQNQLNYPVVAAGLVTAPRGAGTMLAMMLVGRLIGQVDSRYIMAVGLFITGYSLKIMTSYSLLTDSWAIVSAGVIQGFGIGLAYVPLSTVAFSTLPKEMRNEGTAFFNLMRNLGSSIGISVVETLLTRNTQIVHSELSEHLTPYNAAANSAYIANHINILTPSGLAALNNMVTNQAIMVAYIDDYQLMMVITFCVIPLIFLLQKPKKALPTDQPIIMD
jgi:DHA2 family multidrug resistance protein